MNSFGTFMLVAWLAVGLAMFAIYLPRKAALITALGGMLFLPIYGVKFGEGIPVYSKIEAIGLAVLMGTIIFNSEALLAFRPHWIDLPMVVWCVCPFASSISNDLGAYDGLSAVASNALRWGLPYFIGRIYITDWQAARDVAIAIVAAAVIYIPLCLFENRMGPLLHYNVYGVAAGGADDYGGFGIFGWRPSVFMQTALQLTLFMGCASMIGVWLWLSGSVRSILGMPLGWLLLALILATLLTKSLGANLLWVAGLGGLLAARFLGTRLVLVVLLLFAPIYAVVRGTQMWDAQSLVDFVHNYTTETRFESFKTRIENENSLAAKSLQKPAAGWGRWDRARVLDETGKDVSKSDGLWIITLGDSGWVGLGSVLVAMLLPSAMILYRARRDLWRDGRTAATLALAVLLILYMIDNLFNAMLNPIWVIACGGLANLATRSSGRKPFARPVGDDALRFAFTARNTDAIN